MIDRRSVLLGSLGAGCALGIGSWPRIGFAQDRPFTFVSWGGAFEKMQREAFVEPFAAGESLDYVVAGPPEVAKVKAMVDAGTIEWDVVVLDGRSVWRGADEGFLEPLDYDRIPNAAPLDPEWRLPHGVVTSVGASMIAWAKEAFPDGGPQSWADVWDVKRFPGGRGMYFDFFWNYEVAMLAEGLTRDEIYPVTDEKADIAFAKLEELKPHVRVWWRSGPQPAQMLSSGEATVSSAWSGRVFAAIDGGAAIDFTFNEALAWGSYLTIAKGSPHVDVGHELINFSAGLAPQTKLLDLNVYGPALETAADRASEKVRKTLVMAPENLDKIFILDTREGAKYSVKYEERWNQFLLA